MLDTHIFWQSAHNKHQDCSLPITLFESKPRCLRVYLISEGELCSSSGTEAPSEHRPDLTLTVKHFYIYLQKVWDAWILNPTNCCGSSSLNTSFTSFPTSGFYQINLGGGWGGGGGWVVLVFSCLGSSFLGSILSPGQVSRHIPHLFWR